MPLKLIRLDTRKLFIRGGPVDIDLHRRAQRVGGKARTDVVKKTEQLKTSIIERHGREPLTWEVAAVAPYAMWIHDGKRYDPRSGRTIYVRVGPRPFLKNALVAAR